MCDLVAGGSWQKEPEFQPWELGDWLIKYDLKTGQIEGKIVAKGVHLINELEGVKNSTL